MNRALAFVGALAVLAVSGGCVGMQGALGIAEIPTLDFQSAELAELSPQSATVQLTYRLNNPYPVELPVSEADFQVELAGRPLVSGATPRGVHVAPNGASPVVLDARVALTELPLAASVFGRGVVHYRVRGHIGVDTPAGVVQLPLSNEGELDIRRASAFADDHVPN